MTREGRSRATRQPGKRIAGQASTEMIVIVVLVALVTVAIVTMYGRRVGTKYSCAGESVANGGGAVAGCSGEANGGVEVDAISGADPRVASSAPGAGTATGGAAQRKPGDAARPDILPVIPTPRGRVGFDATPQDQAGQPAVVANVPVVPSSGGESRSASSGASRGKAGESADDLADFLEPGGGPGLGGAPQLAGQPAVVANAPVVPSSGGESRSASSGAPRGKAGESADNLSDFLEPGGGPGSGGAPQLAGQSLANAPGLPSVGGGSGTASGGTTQQGTRRPVVVDIPPPVFKGDGGPGTAPRSAPLQTFDELVSAGPNAPALPGSGAGGGASRQQVTEFVLGGPPLQRLNDAAGDLRKVPGGEATVNGIIDRGTIIEVKGTDGSSKFFRVDNPFKEFRDDTFGRVPERGVVRDRSKVIVEEASAKSAADPKAPRIVVNDQQTTGEIALELFRQRGPIRLEPQLDASVRAGVDADDRAKARQDFVKKSVDLEAGRAFNDIQLKKELQRQGATVNTTLPFEAEHQTAFNKAFAEELGKGTGAKAAVGAGTNAADRAVTDAVQKGGVVAERSGKAFDQRFDQFVKQNPDKVKQAERYRKIEEARKTIVELVNSVDSKSAAADQVAAIVTAFAIQHPDQVRLLLVEGRKGLPGVLGQYGFKDVEELGSFRMEQARFDYAIANFAALDEKQRAALRTGRARPFQFGIKTVITYEEMLEREEQKVPVRVGDGKTSILVTRRERRELERQAIINYALESLALIRQPGPAKLLGAFFGEEAMRRGAAVDTILVARYRGPAAARTGGKGGADQRPSIRPEVRRAPAPPRDRIAVPDRAAPPPPRQPANPPVRINTDLSGATGGKRDGLNVPAGNQPQVASNQPRQQQQVQQQQQQRQNDSRPGQQTSPGGDTGVDAGRRQRQADQKAADAQRAQRAKDQAARQARDAQRQADLARRVAAANEALKRQEKNLPRDDQNITADEAISRAKKGDFSLVISMNGGRHQEAFDEKLLAQQLKGNKPVDISKNKPPLRNVFTDGKQVRINFESLTDAQKAEVQALATGTSSGGSGGGGAVDPRGNTQPQVDPRANTQPRPPTQPQSPPKPPDTGKFEAKTGREQQTGRLEKKTGEITRPGAAKDGAAKADTGVPGNFPSKDVVFGLSVGDPKKGPVAKFAGNALNAANPDHLPLSGKATTPAGIADETVGAARTVLKASGGTLRFSLAKFSVDEALTPGSEHFNTTTSIEFRRVLTDPFFRGRVRFYDDKGVDITDSIVKRSVPKVTSR